MALPIRSADDLLTQGVSAPMLEAPQADEVAKTENTTASQETPHEYSVPEVAKATDVGATASESIQDDYGNEIPKQQPRTYSEEEVQAMIRDRLSRGRHSEPAPQPQVQNTPDGFAYNESSDKPWQQQLEDFIGATLEKRERTNREQMWRHQEQQTQAQFEIKFNQGAAKYGDFEKVVMDKPITPAMMRAARGMSDPAAFIYAASKIQPQELSRIAQLPDPVQQALEIGKLEERMKKAKTVSSAPKPVS